MVATISARVLVCDPSRSIFEALVAELSRKFQREELPSFGPSVYQALASPTVLDFSKVEVTLVDKLEEVENAIEAHPIPHFSLVAYETLALQSAEVKTKTIAKLRNRDYFLPQMILGKGLNSDVIGQFVKAGVLNIGESVVSLRSQINNIYSPPRTVPGLTVVKIGGSTFDFDRENPGAFNLQVVCNELDRLHKNGKPILVTVGAGQYGDIVKEHLRKYGDIPRVRDRFPRGMANALEANLEGVRPLFPSDVTLRNTGTFYGIAKENCKKKIQLMDVAPHYIMARDSIPLQDSDTHTIAMAEFYGAERVILIKRTDGIYKFDPLRGRAYDSRTKQVTDVGKWVKAQEQNKMYGIVSVDRFLSGEISREGTSTDGVADGSSGHLMEESALRYMKHNCRFVKEVVVVHIAPEEMHYQVGYKTWKHVVTGDERDVHPQKGWEFLLRENIRESFKGASNSKIVNS